MSPELLDTLSMFAFLSVELSVLFIGISLAVGALQRHIPQSTIEALLSSNKSRSYFLAAGLGALTPFCSCSTVPMLKGLIRARAGFGPMMVFLFSSPLLNPIIIALLSVTFGLTLTSIYAASALLVSLGAGWLLQALGFERYILSEQSKTTSCCAKTPPIIESCCDSNINAEKSCGNKPTGCGEAPVIKGKYDGLWKESWSDFMDVFPYLIIGIAIGSLIYGYLPTELIQQYAVADNPFAIPVAAVIGIPLYIRAEAVIPLAAALMTKGVGAGTVLALIIGSAGASLTELILLRSLFSLKLLAAFVLVIFVMAITAGYATFIFF